MNKLVLFMVSLFLAVSVQAHAGDLGWAGAFSGAGKAMGDSLAAYQSMLLQQQLLEQRDRMEREREERAYQRQQERERAERLNYEQAARAKYERAQAENLQQLTDPKQSASAPQSLTYSDDPCDTYAKASPTSRYEDEYARCLRILGR
ncbi:MAG: hypothetical protein HOP32_09410 [Nitrospira sp.]|nr:hypothetical protein [Nitrospira sp.]